MSKLYLTAAEADEAARRAIRWLCTSVQRGGEEMERTAVELFVADYALDLEHDINEWITDPAEHDGIISIQYSVAAIPGKECAIYSALVHYKLKDD